MGAGKGTGKRLRAKKPPGPPVGAPSKSMNPTVREIQIGDFCLFTSKSASKAYQRYVDKIGRVIGVSRSRTSRKVANFDLRFENGSTLKQVRKGEVKLIKRKEKKDKQIRSNKLEAKLGGDGKVKQYQPSFELGDEVVFVFDPKNWDDETALTQREAEAFKKIDEVPVVIVEVREDPRLRPGQDKFLYRIQSEDFNHPLNELEYLKNWYFSEEDLKQMRDGPVQEFDVDVEALKF